MLIEKAMRLADTNEAWLGLVLAAAAFVAGVVAAVVVRIRKDLVSRQRFAATAALVAAGVLAAGLTIHYSHQAWYRHRCVYHHSDIEECSADSAHERVPG